MVEWLYTLKNEDSIKVKACEEAFACKNGNKDMVVLLQKLYDIGDTKESKHIEFNYEYFFNYTCTKGYKNLAVWLERNIPEQKQSDAYKSAFKSAVIHGRKEIADWLYTISKISYMCCHYKENYL